jgi:lipopolysaccharide biosynthesis glycosyltransferase
MIDIPQVDKREIVLILSADDGYAMQLAVTLRSIIDNLSPRRTLSIFVLDGGIQEINKTKIIRSLKKGRYKIQWLQPPLHLLAWAKQIRYFTLAAYLRLLVPKILPLEVKKAIYLDCDLIVLKDLGDLWNVEMDDQYTVAVQDGYLPYVSSHNVMPYYLELGLSGDSKYFNSGVMVINIQKWRSIDILELSREIFEKYARSDRLSRSRCSKRFILWALARIRFPLELASSISSALLIS